MDFERELMHTDFWQVWLQTSKPFSLARGARGFSERRGMLDEKNCDEGIINA